MNKGDNPGISIFKKQAIDSKQALETVKTGFPDDSPHITRIEEKLRKLEHEGIPS